MRKKFLFLLGSLTGAGLTLLISAPQGEYWVARAKAAATAADTYSQLNLFGEVFERVRSDYVEKPDDSSLVEGAINGMVTSLDPHSRYMNDKAWREMQERVRRARHRGHDGRRPGQGRLSDRRYAGLEGRHHVG
jgi:carboxyl-terminal processing protease